MFLFDWLATFEEQQQRAGTFELSDPAFGGVTNPETPGTQTPVTSVPSSQSKNLSTTWVHCSVGPEMEPGEEDVERQQVRCASVSRIVRSVLQHTKQSHFTS